MEVKKVGSTSDINVIAQLDFAQEGITTKRYFLKKGKSLNNDIVEDMKETNMGDPECLKRFINWGQNKYKADHYMLILWDHGTGWDDTNIYADKKYSFTQRIPGKSKIWHAIFKKSIINAAKLSDKNFKTYRLIGTDDNSKDFLDNAELKAALITKPKIDILGMDACLMSMAEVVYQLRDNVNYIVCSEQIEPVEGWPYDKILDYLSKHPNLSPTDLSKIIVDSYIDSYNISKEEVT
jgi:hypothetical protein